MSDTLVSKNYVIDKLKKSKVINQMLSDSIDNTTLDYAIAVVDEAPSVEENYDETILHKHAKWIPEHHGGFSPGGNPLYRCSNCGWIFGTHMIFPNYRYCPDCGSVMDKE